VTYRNRALLNLAHRLNRCPLCGHHSMHGLEPAHSDQQKHGKGMGHKAADQFHAAICHECHAELPKLSREARNLAWQQAFEATLTAYWENGWLSVNK
jgi:hypothetical protein